MEKITEFMKKIKEMQEKARIALRRIQEKMKQQADRKSKEADEQKVGDKVILNTKDLVFKEQPAKKLVN